MSMQSLLLLSMMTLAMNGAFAASPATAKKPLPKASDFVELGDSGDANSTGSAKSADEDASATALAPNEKLLTGTVRVIRKIQYTEAFFKDINDSYIIPSGNAYPSIYTAFLESQKKGTAVSFKVNTKSRRVLSIEDTPPAGGGAADAGNGVSTSAGAAGSGKNTGSK